jgi:8-oxo-dGTP pyrophosphatase MutT (NUDIX family)
MKQYLRGLAICLFTHRGKILVAEGCDPLKKEIFYRPLGGSIEFGEYGVDTVRRELLEEINAEVADLRYLFTVENIFTFNGEKGHEIVMVYDGRFVDERLYAQAEITGIEDEAQEIFTCSWKHLDEFGPGRPPLYPDRLLENLQALGLNKIPAE